MSLRIWLPLTKDLRNQGLDDVTVTNNGATFNSAGKLGGCYSFGTGNSYIIVDSAPLKTFTEFSFACWVKIISWNTNYSTIFAAKNSTGVSWNNLIFSLLRDSSTSALCFNISNGSSYTATSCRTGTLSLNTWYHIACTYKSGQIKLYQDGNVVSIYNTNVIPNFNSIVNLWIGKSNENSYQSNNLLNDVRIYDHALSPLEVKHISQGLILHYPLSRGGWGQENLLKYTKVNVINQNLLKNNKSSAWGNLTLTTKDGYDCYFYPSTQNSTWFSSGSWYTGMKANTTYTYTAWIYFTANANFTFTSLGHFQVYNSASTASDKAHEDIVSARIYEPSTIVANTWTKVRITFTTNDLANSYFVIYPRYNIGTGVGDLYFRDCKLEESAVPTLWCPNSVDNEYSIMGLSSTIEYDCSGFCNNGTRIGTFNWTSDTPKYNVSTIFTDGCSINTINNLSNPCSEFSVGGWVNLMEGYIKNNGCHLISFNGIYCRICISKDGLAVRILLTNGSTNYMGGSTLKDSALTANKWNYFVITFKSGIIKIYINGLLDADLTATITQINFPSSNISIGQYGSEKPNAKVSDFRFYVTALSADDVKSLYNNSAYIDNQGNIYGAVYEEV